MSRSRTSKEHTGKKSPRSNQYCRHAVAIRTNNHKVLNMMLCPRACPEPFCDKVDDVTSICEQTEGAMPTPRISLKKQRKIEAALALLVASEDLPVEGSEVNSRQASPTGTKKVQTEARLVLFQAQGVKRGGFPQSRQSRFAFFVQNQQILASCWKGSHRANASQVRVESLEVVATARRQDGYLVPDLHVRACRDIGLRYSLG